MKQFQELFFYKYEKCKKVNYLDYKEFPIEYLNLVNGYQNINLSQSLYFPYTKGNEENEYWIGTLYGIKETKKKIKDFEEAFDMPYKELFFKDLIPLATSDGHTGVGVRNSNNEKKEIYFIDYEGYEYYWIAKSFKDFLNKCFISNSKYTYEIKYISEELLKVLNSFIKKILMSDNIITIDKINEHISRDKITISNMYLFGKFGSDDATININKNLYKDSSRYREFFRKDAELILEISLGRKRLGLTKEIEKFELLHKDLSCISGVEVIRKYGNCKLTELI